MRFTKYLFIVLCITACSSAKDLTSEVNTSDTIVNPKESLKDKNVKVTLSTYIPHCGGMAPTEEMLNRYNPFTEEVNLIDLSDGSKTKCTPNSEGVFLLSLPNGKYAIQELYKDVSYSKFISENSVSGAYIQAGTEECYRKWWKSYLTTFEVSELSSSIDVKGIRSPRCFTGNDPCSRYDGPMPP